MVERSAGRAKKFDEPGGELIARLAYFYGIDPLRLTELPIWMLDTLATWLPRLHAEAQLRGAEVAMLPWMKQDRRGAMLRRWERLARRTASADKPTAPDPAERNAEKARAWFAAMGAKVVEVG